MESLRIKPNVLSSTYTRVSPSRSKIKLENSSPINRITSDKNLKHHMLPNFMRSPLTPTPVATKSLNLTLPNFKSHFEMSEYINSAQDPLKALLKLGKIELKQDDLKSLLSGSPTKPIINCLLNIMTHLSNKSSKSSMTNKRILIARTDLTQKVLNNEQTGLIIDLSRISLLIFPIFVGHWTVLVLNCIDLIIHYYDPKKSNKYLEEILKNLCLFLKSESTNQLSIQNQHKKELVYQNILIEDDFIEVDSAVFMLKTIYNLIIGDNSAVKADRLPHTRKLFLRLLFQYGKY